MKGYELVNMSDMITFEAPDDRVAQAVGLIVGEGRVAVRGELGESVLPLFLLGGGDAWVEENFKDPGFGDFVRANHEAVATAMERLFYGSHNDRRAFFSESPTLKALHERNDKKRTSLSDWGGHAAQMAEAIRIQAKKEAARATR